MIDFVNETGYKIDPALFNTIYDYLSIRDIECLIVDAATMRSINLEARGFDKSTDVLSFPLEQTTVDSMLGTIIICYDLADEYAQKLGHDITMELKLLFIHGMLHLLGYDHETDQGEMRHEEEKLIHHFSLPESLIIRNQE